jgi:hypothetical protein
MQKQGASQIRAKCSLALMLASKAPVAVVLRRGPTNWVQMIRWDLRNDSFEAGQWFKGRIYPELSELSEDGELLLYSARKTTGWTLNRRNDIGDTWTAISRPPYFTALALWANGCWTGGGIFTDTRGVKIDLPYPKPHAQLPTPQLEVQGTPDLGLLPLSLRIALRAHWAPLDQPVEALHDIHWQLKTRQSKEIGQGAVRIIKSTHKGKHWMLRTSFSVSNVHGETDLGEADLVDFDSRGRLIQSRDGRLLVCDRPSEADLQWRELADFSASRPAPLPPKEWAIEWPPTAVEDVER